MPNSPGPHALGEPGHEGDEHKGQDDTRYLDSRSNSSPSSCKLLHHGAAASSEPHSLLWLPSRRSSSQTRTSRQKGNTDAGNVVYASDSIISIAKSYRTRHDNEEIMHVRETLRTDSVSRAENGRVITALAAVNVVPVSSFSASESGETKNQEGEEGSSDDGSSGGRIVASAFSDGTLNLWIEENTTKRHGTWEEKILIGTDSGGTSSSMKGCTTAITDVAGLCLRRKYLLDGDEGNSGRSDCIILVTGTSDGVFLHTFHRNNHVKDYEDGDEKVSRYSDIQTKKIGGYAVASVNIQYNQNVGEIVIFIGTASPRHNRVQICTAPVKVGECSNVDKQVGGGGGEIMGDAVYQGGLMGHQDWITSLAWKISTRDNLLDGGMLASGSKDAKIRLWTFRTVTNAVSSGNAVTPEASLPTMESSTSFHGSSLDDDNDDVHLVEEEDEEEEEEGEARLQIFHSNGYITNVFLEALLLGHEESVTSVCWHPTVDQCILSSSMDRSILIWAPEPDSDDDDEIAQDNVGQSDKRSGGGVWTPLTRVGSAGGILGGPVGSSLLGFVDASFDLTGTRIVGHAYGGSLHFWSSSTIRDTGKRNQVEISQNQMDQWSWRADPCLTGHFGPVHDISWEVTRGEYLLSASGDQTCRLWAEVPIDLTDKGEEDSTALWAEVGRPQVHGYDLMTVASIGTGERMGLGDDDDGRDQGNTPNPTVSRKHEPRHRFVSGADEKELRAFDAPLGTLRLLRALHVDVDNGGTDSGEETEDRVERAYLPSLGLSNRATADEGMEEQDQEMVKLERRRGSVEEKALNFSSFKKTVRLPLERDLGVSTLWPEVQKLFGHRTELVCVTSSVTARTGPTYDTPFQDVIVASACKARDVENASIRLWDVDTGICIEVLKGGHRSTVATLSFSPDGRYLASSGKDRRLCIWRRELRPPSLPKGDVEAELNKGARLSDDRKVDIAKSESLPSFTLASAVDGAHKRIVWSVHFCPVDPTLLVSGSRDGFVKVWRVMETNDTAIWDVQSRPERQDDVQVHLKELYKFEPASQKPRKKVEAVTSLAFAPKPIVSSDGTETDSILAMGLECGLIEIWAVRLPDFFPGDNDAAHKGDPCRLIFAIPFCYCHIDTVKKLAWRPVFMKEGKHGTRETTVKLTLASCGMDHGVRIFDLDVCC